MTKWSACSSSAEASTRSTVWKASAGVTEDPGDHVEPVGGLTGGFEWFPDVLLEEPDEVGGDLVDVLAQVPVELEGGGERRADGCELRADPQQPRARYPIVVALGDEQPRVERPVAVLVVAR